MPAPAAAEDAAPAPPRPEARKDDHRSRATRPRAEHSRGSRAPARAGEGGVRTHRRSRRQRPAADAILTSAAARSRQHRRAAASERRRIQGRQRRRVRPLTHGATRRAARAKYPCAMAKGDPEKLTIAPIVGPDDPRRFTDSGIEIERSTTRATSQPGLEDRLGEPGEYPYTRGVHKEMYRSRLWTMRQYAGYATARETNERFRYLIEHGSTGLSMAFDLPTQLGRDSDDPLCLGRGRPHRRGHRHDRRHAQRLRRHPAGQGLDLDDHQRARRVPAAALRTRGRGAGRASPRS